MSTRADELINEYLDRLEEELADFPSTRRRELVQEISAHIAEARASLENEDEASIRTPILEKYDREGSPYYSTARLWDDGVLDPARTREALALGLSAAYNAPIAEPKFGVFRM